MSKCVKYTKSSNVCRWHSPISLLETPIWPILNPEMLFLCTFIIKMSSIGLADEIKLTSWAICVISIMTLLSGDTTDEE